MVISGDNNQQVEQISWINQPVKTIKLPIFAFRLFCVGLQMSVDHNADVYVQLASFSAPTHQFEYSYHHTNNVPWDWSKYERIIMNENAVQQPSSPVSLILPTGRDHATDLLQGARYIVATSSNWSVCQTPRCWNGKWRCFWNTDPTSQIYFQTRNWTKLMQNRDTFRPSNPAYDPGDGTISWTAAHKTNRRTAMNKTTIETVILTRSRLSPLSCWHHCCLYFPIYIP